MVAELGEKLLLLEAFQLWTVLGCGKEQRVYTFRKHMVMLSWLYFLEIKAVVYKHQF